jgi:hypothetical protein
MCDRPALEAISEKTGKPVDVEKVLAHAINFMLDKKMDMTNTEG